MFRLTIKYISITYRLTRHHVNVKNYFAFHAF